MSTSFWHKQVAEEPLFKDLLWSKPENKAHAGKLLIIGGNAHAFSAPATAYAIAQQTGIGVAKVLLPEALRKPIGGSLENGEFAKSNNSGSFSKLALAEWLDFANWADGVLLAGELSNNSETVTLIEQFLIRFEGQVTMTQDAISSIVSDPSHALSRPNTILVTDFPQLQKITTNIKFKQALLSNMPIASVVDHLHVFTATYKAAIALNHNDTFFIAKDGQVSTTKVTTNQHWQVAYAAKLSVWALQNPSKLFAALTTAVYET